MLQFLAATVVLLLSFTSSHAFFWPQATAPQAPLFQPPAALNGYAQQPPASIGSHGYDTEPSTTTALPAIPPVQIACIPPLPTLPAPQPIQLPVLKLADSYAQPFTTFAPLTFPTFPTFPPPKPIEFSTLPPPAPIKFPTFAELFPQPQKSYAVAPPIFVAPATTIPPRVVTEAYEQPKEEHKDESYAQPASFGARPEPPPAIPTSATIVHRPAVEQSGY